MLEKCKIMKKHLRIALIILSSCWLISCHINRAGGEKSGQSPSDYAIAYNVLVDSQEDDYEVFTMNLDGSAKQNITRLPGVEWTYYSYRDKLYFISDQDSCSRCYFLYQTNYQGDHSERISDIQLADSWMSSRNKGQEIIVKPSPAIDSVLYIINQKGQLVQRLATGLPYGSDPLFVNDGQQVVFRGGMTKSKLIDGFNEALYVIDSDGKNRRQLTNYPAKDTTASKFDYRAGTPKLHPTEHFISFQSKQKGKYRLFAVTLTGDKQWEIFENTKNMGWHDWSPDGQWLAVELFDQNQEQFDIGLVNWQTKEMTILTDTSYQYQQSPNFVVKNNK